jgi:hypothetical protein
VDVSAELFNTLVKIQSGSEKGKAGIIGPLSWGGIRSNAELA